MEIKGDFHIHGRYAQACSKNTTIDDLEKNAKIKGLDILGTGDAQHPLWYKEITSKLTEDENGILWTKEKFPFIWQTEISLMYTHHGKGRRVHHVVLLPNKEVVDQFIESLLKKGRIDYDGRPIFGWSSIEFLEILRSISPDIELIPAHCLLPNEPISTNKGYIPISQLDKSFKVFTHKGRYKEIEQVLKRRYSGEIIGFKTAYYNILTKFTPEHPIYLIKSFKDCKNVPHTICKPICAYAKNKGCKILKFRDYIPEWIQAKNIEKGDIAPFPINKKINDVEVINLKEFLPDDLTVYYEKDLIKARKEKIFKKNKGIHSEIKITEGFCRLVGYYLSEGYVTLGKIGFCFHKDEKEYINDVKILMKNCFGDDLVIYNTKRKNNDLGISFEIHSKVLAGFFKSFYKNEPYEAENKMLPFLFLELPFEKQKQLFIGWWRGDKGNTVSTNLINQMWNILLRLKIMPIINLNTAESVNKRRLLKSNIIDERKIIAKNDCYSISSLVFFDENLDLLKMEEFKKFKSKLKRRKVYFDENYVYLPITKIQKEEYEGEVYNLEVKDDNSYVSKNLAVHNCWTSYFGILGSKSGYDSVESCFQEHAKHIHALESGISSTPAMNRRISSLDKYKIVSFSDPHSAHPWRLGREATIFDLKKLTYKEIIHAIRNEGISGTIEANPEYGKYHIDGHRNCNVALTPEETKKVKGICPVCRKELTIGVAYRIEELADRKEPKNVLDFKEVIPLTEVIAAVYNLKQLNSKKIEETYNLLIKAFNNEYNILLETPFEDLKKIVPEKLAQVILLNRENKLTIKPGYDGVYGEIILNDNEKMQREEIKKVQKSITDF